jgi:hypothetical protein
METKINETNETRTLVEKDEIIKFCKNHEIKIMMNFINIDGSFIAKGDVDLSGQNLQSMPVKIVGCLGDFNISNNKFKNLKGMPTFVEGEFNCNNNELTSLEGSPRYVLKDYDIRANATQFTPEMVQKFSFVYNEIFTDYEARLMQIHQFFTTKEEVDEFCKENDVKNYKINEDLTLDVNGNVNLSDKNLSVLPFKFRDVRGCFDCSHNNLFSLINAPRSVGGDFICSFNKLKDIIFAPQTIGGSFICSFNSIEKFDFLLPSIAKNLDFSNNELSSLLNSPSVINGSFACSNNKLRDLNYSPKIIRGNFICNNNRFLKSICESPSYVEGDYHLYKNGRKFSVHEIRDLSAVWGRVFTDVDEGLVF